MVRLVAPASPHSAGVAAAMLQLCAGGAVLLYDATRDCADLIAAAETTTASVVSLMAREGRGIVAVALTSERCRQLDLRALPACADRGGRQATRDLPLVSIEARHGVTTGISARDRAHTIRVAGSPQFGAHDLVNPGHVFPVEAVSGGTFERTGRSEAATDAMRLAGQRPAAAMCDVLDDDGDLATFRHVADMADRLRLPLVELDEIVQARCELEWNAW